MTCPHCGDTRTYTDPMLQVRCLTCFNHRPGPITRPIGAMHDDTAPIVIPRHTPPREPIHHGR